MDRDSVAAELSTAFPELEEIESESLREKTRSVWVTALARGGWTVADLDDVPASLHLVGTGIGLLAHTRAVTRVALATVDAYEAYYPDGPWYLNRDFVAAGGLLHDVGKVLEYDRVDGEWTKSAAGEYVRHPFSGVALCDAADVPPAVQQIVAFHSHEGNSYERSPESTVLHYADFLNFDPIRATMD